MKIAQVAPLMESVPPRLYGGTERIVSYLADELVRLGAKLRRFPPDVEQAARAAAAEVLAGFDAKGGLDQRIYRSFAAMQGRAVSWSRHASQAFLEARNGA